jgi:hypothetical protein
MHRRTFIRAAASSLLIPSGIVAAHPIPGRRALNDGDHFFFDERFTEARRLAEELGETGTVTPVRGDVTGTWNTELKYVCRHTPLTLHGVTTESFYFCLEVMLQSHAEVKSQISRVNRDLFLWTIRSHVKSM